MFKKKQIELQPVIGLEVHVQLATRSKIFSWDKNEFGSEPNQNIGPITIAHPGTLPVLNKQAVDFAIRMGLALDCEITRKMTFDRKNYFYPDLPKGFQITQDATPICRGGGIKVELESGDHKFIELTKIHLEEDAGKSIHVDGKDYTNVDLNRAGVPLIEIVTEPIMATSEEAMLFLTEIRKIVRYLEISDGNMEEGSLRCDANVSLHEKGKPFGSKVEIKNMNSIKNVRKAIDKEIQRQREILSQGGEVISETRTFNPQTGQSAGMRTKEELNDYRYFTEPDLSPIEVSQEWIDEIKSTMPELPGQLRKRLTEEFELPEYDAGVITDEKEMAQYFLEVSQHSDHHKLTSNFVMGKIRSYLNEHSIGFRAFPIEPKKLADFINLIGNGVITNEIASKKLFPYLLENPDTDVGKAVNDLGLTNQEGEDFVLRLVNEVLDENPDKVKAYHNGKKGLTGMFMGEVMKRSKGKADPQQANKLITETLESRK